MIRRYRSQFTTAIFGILLAALAAAGTPAAAQGRAAGLPDFTDLYDKQGPAVVAIDVTQKVRRGRGLELSEDDPFYEFFRRFGQIPRQRPGPEREFEQQSVGSGFLISSDGYLITLALHELVHGLGLFATVTGDGSFGQVNPPGPAIYDRFVTGILFDESGKPKKAMPLAACRPTPIAPKRSAGPN